MPMISPSLNFFFEHYDTLAQKAKKYRLFYYLENACLEIYIKNISIFLKSIENLEVKITSLYRL